MFDFDYDVAFSRNLGLVSAWEQQRLRSKRVAIAGMGGVGGVHLLTLARLGIGRFHIAEADTFELANFNRQVGATMATIGRPKIEVMAEQARAINPELELRSFEQGVNADNVEAFLEGVDLYVDGIDFFALEARQLVFRRCKEKGIPAITAGPIGLSTAYLLFTPDGMSFDDYFGLEGRPEQEQYVNFLVGLQPRGLARNHVVDPSRLDLAGRRGPSAGMACQLCAGVVGIEALKLLLGRGTIKPAPWYHQFDPYHGRFVKRRMWLGHRNPLQALRRRVGYRLVKSAYSRSVWPSSAQPRTEMEAILDRARWAPSGDNVQPWRFEILGDDALRVHIHDDALDDLYDYGGQPALLSSGMLLESIRLAASRHGRAMTWQYAQRGDHDHVVDVALPAIPHVHTDELERYLAVRSVDRRRYLRKGITAEHKRVLEDALGPELEIRWLESRRERWQATRLSAQATDLRLRIPEAHEVHRRVVTFEQAFPRQGIPAAALGLGRVLQAATRFSLTSFARAHVLNRFVGGTVLPRIFMDLIPGLLSSAHFLIAWKQLPAEDARRREALAAGEAIQRFWLRATSLGLALQPSFAPLMFAYNARHDVPFTAAARDRKAARRIQAALDRIWPAGDRLVFAGRIGWPQKQLVPSRSVRLELEELVQRRDARERHALAEASITTGSPP